MCANNPTTSWMRSNLKQSGSAASIPSWPAPPQAPVKPAAPPLVDTRQRAGVAGTKTLLGG